MRTAPVALAALLAILLGLATAAPAPASPAGVIRDCSEDGILNGTYSQSELDGALEDLPSDLDEYTDCRSVIRRAQLKAAGDKRRPKRDPSTADQVDAASPPTGEEQQQIAKAAGAGDSVRIGGTGVRPGARGEPFDSAGFGTDLPSFVAIVVLALVGLTVSGLVLAGRRRWAAPGTGEGGPLGRIGEGVRRGISRFRR